MVGPIGLEPKRGKSERIDKKTVASQQKDSASEYANTPPGDPIKRLAEAWNSLPQEVQDAIALLVERIIDSSKKD